MSIETLRSAMIGGVRGSNKISASSRDQIGFNSADARWSSAFIVVRASDGHSSAWCELLLEPVDREIVSALRNGEMGEVTEGVLVVDGYRGYNDIENVSSRRRAACLAHVRRYFFDALRTGRSRSRCST